MLKSFLRRFLALVIVAILLTGLIGLKSSFSQSIEDELASSPSECHSRDVDTGGDSLVHTTPKNCFFLEEPIGGKPGYDLYLVTCGAAIGGGAGEEKQVTCIYTLWHGGAIPEGAHGPVQAILSYEPDKPYQGPFGLLYSYLGLIYGYMSGLIVGIVVLFIVVGGIQMITSAGGEGYNAGKQRIIKALIGLVLWFTASLILYTINPTFFAF
jgi:hypothetical protein